MVIKIGASGFEYTVKDSRPQGAGMGGRKSRTVTVDIINSSTKAVAFTIRSSHTRYSSRTTTPSTGMKTFFGFDNRYYHVTVRLTNVQWGQVQSDGAVIKENRTVLKHLNFYPMEVTPTTVPTLKTVVKPPEIPPISALPAVISINSKPETQETISWIQRLINWIKKILNT